MRYRLPATGHRLLRRTAHILLAVSAIACNEKGVDFFFPGTTSPKTGNLTGLVANGTVPIVGANVSLGQNLSTTTNSSGVYNFLDLTVGQYTVTTTATGFTCIVPTVTIVLDQTATQNIACTPLPGSVTGTVRVSGTAQSGVTVTLTQGSNTVGTATTGANGTYTIASVPPGTYSASVTPPANTTCTPNPQNVTVVTQQAATANFDCTPIPGGVTGVVRVGGTGRSGVAVTLTQGSTTIGSTTTGTGGAYTFSNVVPGTYSVTITPPANTTCTSNPQSVTVSANQTATANFDCTPLAGGIVGTVRIDGAPAPGRIVVVSQGIATAGTATTGIDGTYRVGSLAPGTYSVSVTPPAGGTCTPNPQTVTVQANQDATANFDCATPQNDFAIAFGDPPPSYRHIVAGISSEVCAGFSLNPMQLGATWTTMWTGPGTVGTNSRTGTFDSSNHVTDRQGINAFGTYNLHVEVVSGTTTRTADASVVVTAAAGSCPAPPP